MQRILKMFLIGFLLAGSFLLTSCDNKKIDNLIKENENLLSENSEFKKAYEEKLKNIKVLNEKVKSLETETKTLKESIETLKSEKEALNKELKALKESLEASNTENSTLEAEIETLETTISEKETEITALTTSLETKENEITTLKSEVETLKTKVSELEEKIKDLEDPKNIIYNVNLVSNDLVTLSTDSTNHKALDEVIIKVTILDDYYTFNGFKITNDISYQVVSEKDHTYKFIMPNHAVRVEALLKEVKIKGTFLCEVGLSLASTNKNLLKIDEHLNYSLIRNNDYENILEGKLIEGEYNYYNQDKSIILYPVYDKANNLMLIAMRYYDEVSKKGDYYLFNNHYLYDVEINIPITNFYRNEIGALIQVSLSNTNETALLSISNQEVFKVTFKENTSIDNLDQSTIYELTGEDKKTRYFKYDGVNLYENNVERGTYKSLNANGYNEYIYLDGFGSFLDVKEDIREETGTYYYDSLNNKAILTYKNREAYCDITEGSVDEPYDYIEERQDHRSYLTDLVYVFNTKELREAASISVRIRFGFEQRIEGEVMGVKFESTKLENNILTVKLYNEHILKFTLDPNLYSLTHISGYLINEGDMDGLVLKPTRINSEKIIADMGLGYVRFTDSDYVFKRVENGSDLHTSYVFEEHNNKLYVRDGGDLIWLIDFKKGSAIIYQPDEFNPQ